MTCYRMKIDPSEPPEIPEESLTCDICGQRFDTVESLEEHKLSEVKDVELKDKGVDQLMILSMKKNPVNL
jgi:transcriptional regulator NrdR family protein